MRICLVYDCLFPHTVGGAERWYRNLGERLAAAGHEVTYLTLRQWDRGGDAVVRGRARARASGPRMELYTGGRRRDPAAARVRRRRARGTCCATGAPTTWSTRPRFRTSRCWRPARSAGSPASTWSWTGTRCGAASTGASYLGRRRLRSGTSSRALCARLPQRAFCFSRLHRDRLRASGMRGEVTVLEGEYAGDLTPPEPRPSEPLVVFAGRHIPEKRAPALVPAVGRVTAELPELRAEIYGDGPDRARVLEAIAAERLDDVVTAPGFVDAGTSRRTPSGAPCAWCCRPSARGTG